MSSLRPTLKNTHLYPIIVKNGVNFPMFKKMPLESINQEISSLGPVRQLWIELIDGLTELDPVERIGCRQALEILDKIEKVYRQAQHYSCHY